MCAKSRSALRRNYIVILLDLYKNRQSVKKKILTDCCGQRWIRTTEDERQQIYSLPHLATLVFALLFAFESLCFLLSRFVSQLRCKDTTIYLNSKQNRSFLLQ